LIKKYATSKNRYEKRRQPKQIKTIGIVASMVENPHHDFPQDRPN